MSESVANAQDLAVVCVSGGMDSLVTTAIAATGHEALALLHASYGQRAAEAERMCFGAIARRYRAAHALAIDLPHLGQIGDSSLTDLSIPVAEADLDNPDIPTSYVPFRNAHFLVVAASWAEVLGARWIYIGAVEEDSSGYPDCRREYYDAFEHLIALGTRPETRISIATPLIRMRKAQIVHKGAALGAPFEHSWSCYRPGPIACGHCDSCALRLRAFREAGVADPISYETAEVPNA